MEPLPKPTLLSDSEPPPYHLHPPIYIQLQDIPDDLQLEAQPLNSNNNNRHLRMTPVARALTALFLTVVGTGVCAAFIISFFVTRHGQLLYRTPPGSFIRAVVFSSSHVGIVFGTRFLIFLLHYGEYQIIIISTISIVLAIVLRLLDLAIDGEL